MLLLLLLLHARYLSVGAEGGGGGGTINKFQFVSFNIVNGATLVCLLSACTERKKGKLNG